MSYARERKRWSEASTTPSVLIAKINITPALLKATPARVLNISKQLKTSRLLKSTTVTSSSHHSTLSSSSPALAPLLLSHHVLHVHCCFISDT